MVWKANTIEHPNLIQAFQSRFLLLPSAIERTWANTSLLGKASAALEYKRLCTTICSECIEDKFAGELSSHRLYARAETFPQLASAASHPRPATRHPVQQTPAKKQNKMEQVSRATALWALCNLCVIQRYCDRCRDPVVQPPTRWMARYDLSADPAICGGKIPREACEVSSWAAPFICATNEARALTCIVWLMSGCGSHLLKTWQDIFAVPLHPNTAVESLVPAQADLRH